MPRRAAVLAMVATAAALLGSLSSPAVAVVPGTALVWQSQAVCAPATAGRATCDSLRLVQRRVRIGSAAYAQRTLRAAAPSALIGPAGGYTPAALAAAYAFNPASRSGADKVVAVVDACYDSKITADLNHFDVHYGLPAETTSTMRVLTAEAGADHCDLQDEQGWAQETALDVEAVRGVCNLCRILLVEGPSSSLLDLAAAEDIAAKYVWVDGGIRLRVTAISNSYGTPETNPGLPSDYATHYRHPGIVVVAANGDDGWYGWDDVNEFNSQPEGAAEVPAALGTVVGVGGTHLILHSNGTRATESVWNDNGEVDVDGSQRGALGASGGGCSRMHAAPGWQASVAGYGALRCATGTRNSTDVAAIADPATGFDIWVTTSSSQQMWETVGGTSLASPVIASMWALAGGGGGARYPGLSLYGAFKSRKSALFDVTTGANGFCGSASVKSCAAQTQGNPNSYVGTLVDCAFPQQGKAYATAAGCRAGEGYDGPSGVGTPSGLRAFQPFVPTAVISRSTSKHRKPTTFSGDRSVDPFPGGRVTTYVWSWGEGHSARVSTVATVAHTYARAGTYRVRLTVKDNFGQTSVARSALVTVK